MARQTVWMKQGDLLPNLTAVLQDRSGPLNITGGTVKFIMRAAEGSVKINASATIVTAASGIVQYTWSGSDTDTAGEFEGEFQVTLSGKKETFPNTGYIPIIILDDIAD